MNFVVYKYRKILKLPLDKDYSHRVAVRYSGATFPPTSRG